jgi:hypothetical protein
MHETSKIASQRPGEFILSEIDDNERRAARLVMRDAIYHDGTLLVDDGDFVGEWEGTGTILGILIGPVDAQDSNALAAYVARDALVSLSKLRIPEGYEAEVAAAFAAMNIETSPGIEIPTEAGTEASTEESTEGGTEASTEEGTEESTEGGTEASTEEGTEASTEESTEGGTEASTEESTEGGTEASTEEGTEASTEEGTEEPSTARRYWRIFVTAIQTMSAASVGIAEVEMRATVGGADQCVGGTPAASTDTGGSFPASNAFDGSNSTRWNSTGAGNTNFGTPQWISYDFGTPVDVAQIALTSINSAAPTFNDRAPAAFRLESSPDNSTWTTEQSWTTGSWAQSETKTFNV